MVTISASVRDSLKRLADLASSEALGNFSDQVPIYKWTDELGRLRVWAANIGAHQVDQSSLDYRLLDASHIIHQTIEVLSGLNQLLVDLDELLQESEVEVLDAKDPGPYCEVEDEMPEETEIQEIYTSLVCIVSNLYQLSMIIRRPAPHDRLVSVFNADTEAFKFWDRKHISDKYPKLEDFLVERLATAMSKQRAILKYRERHREKLSRVSDEDDDLSATTATAFDDAGSDGIHDTHSRSEGSVTSYAQSQFVGEGALKVPEPPEEWADDNPFECPYCYYIIMIRDRREWARHVFHDVMPYACLDASCSTPNRLYMSRRHWYNHICTVHAPTKGVDTTCKCVVCGEKGIVANRFERHLGRHLEDLALFVLYNSKGYDPTGEIEDMDVDGDDEDDILSEEKRLENFKAADSQIIEAPEETEQRAVEYFNVSVQGGPYKFTPKPCTRINCPSSTVFQRESELLRHIRTIHNPPDGPVQKSNPQQCKCEGCPDQTVFQRESDLIQHVRTIHNPPDGPVQKSNPQQCKWEGCPDQTVFQRESDLIQHMRTIHVSPDAYPCSECQRVFLRKDHLRTHMTKRHGYE
ncbi:hypothetical protein BJY01DRAFT_211464 [Aspergillus pseudoustus]|uniref:C2H2-type domain-containing protein n=1 Tax=Aspergillus pseudoustus TaxID=1810923 RepID=A0ABR4K9M6_9EURO